MGQMLFLFNMLPMPVLGIIEGSVSGFGIALSSTFDLIWADKERAPFKFAGLTVASSGLYTVNRFRSVAKVQDLVDRKVTMSAQEAFEAHLITSVFSSELELAEKMKELCGKISTTGPNGVAQQKRYIQKVATTHTNLDKLSSLSAHIGWRQVFDPEFIDAITSIGNPNHKPRYCQKDMSLRPHAK